MEIRQIVCEYEQIPEMLLRRRKKKEFSVFFSVGLTRKKNSKISFFEAQNAKK